MPKSRETKIGTVTRMLTRPSGATLAALCKATGWQAHSARAALSRLRKAGHVIERSPAEGAKGGAVWRIARTPEAAE
jgi:hypothetical protein